jgi:signal transduction histidine kinase
MKSLWKRERTSEQIRDRTRMLRNYRISTKLLFTILPLIFLAVGTSAFLNNLYQERDMLEQAQASAQTYAELIRKSLVEQMVTRERIDDEYLARLSTGGDLDSLHICFMTDSLHLRDMYQSDERTARLRRREMQARAQAGEDVCGINETIYRREGNSFSALIPFKAVARCQQCHAVDQGHVLGVAAMNISLTRITESIQRNWIRSFGVILVFTLAGIFISLLIYRVLIARRLKTLVEATTSIGSGNLERSVSDSSSNDELGELSSAFERMRVRLKKTQDDLIHAERLSTIGQMASSIVHDFRTPMSTINLAIESLEHGKGFSPEKTQQWYRMIHDAVRKMVTMAQELLDFSRGETHLKKGEMPIEDFVTLLVESVKVNLEHARVRLHVRNECTGSANFDAERLHRALVNIINNAQDAMPNGGILRLKIDRHDGTIRFKISDTGSGIPPEIRDTMFEAFVTAGKRKGTGLGLAITKRIVDQHGGTIAVQSEPDKGTAFTVSIPE